MAYDVTLKFETINVGLPLNLTISNMSSIIGSDCFEGGPIPFNMSGPSKIHIPYLLAQCVVEFVFETEVWLSAMFEIHLQPTTFISQIPDSIAFADHFITFNATIEQYFGVSVEDTIIERENYGPTTVRFFFWSHTVGWTPD